MGIRTPPWVEQRDPPAMPLKPGRIGLIAMYLAYAAVVARTLTIEVIRPLLPWYLGLELVYVALLTAVNWKPDLPGWMMHLYLMLQSALILGILSLRPQFDFVVILFLMLSHQASLFFTGRMRWTWVTGLVLLTGGSLSYYLGFIRGLGLALTTMAFEIVIPAYLIVNRDIENARVESELLLNELQDTHQKLETSAGQVEQLAAMQERNHLARELHDSVSQLIFSISLTARSAQLLLERDLARVPEQLNRLKEMTTDALSQLRSFIIQLRPPQEP
jgi:signal transduction histidine kinase